VNAFSFFIQNAALSLLLVHVQSDILHWFFSTSFSSNYLYRREPLSIRYQILKTMKKEWS
jgi:hypothetical protein